MPEQPDDLDLTDEQRALLVAMSPTDRQEWTAYIRTAQEFEREVRATFRQCAATVDEVALTMREELRQPYNADAQEHGLDLMMAMTYLSEFASAAARDEPDVVRDHHESFDRYLTKFRAGFPPRD